MAVRGSPAKGVGSAKGREGSNPSFSAKITVALIQSCGYFLYYGIIRNDQIEWAYGMTGLSEKLYLKIK